MANQINTNHNPVLLNSAQKSGQKPAASNSISGQGNGSPPAADEAARSQGDKVSMTSEASRLQKIEEQLSAVPEVNSARVAEIKAAIADGSFTIDPQTIASKLIAFETGK